MMSNSTRPLFPALLVGCMQIVAAFRQKSRCGSRSQARNGESENFMRVAERVTPVAAVIAALSTLACCLPFGFLGAAGLAGLSVRLQSLRPWLLSGSVVLLVSGFAQLYRRNHCKKRNPVSIALFWCSVIVVVLIILFPQVIASLLAG